MSRERAEILKWKVGAEGYALGLAERYEQLCAALKQAREALADVREEFIAPDMGFRAALARKVEKAIAAADEALKGVKP